MTQLRISPRNLGPLLLEQFCARCYFYQVLMRFKPPFDRPMPGLMFNLDRFEKAIVDCHLAAEGKMPDWLDDLGCVSSIEFPAKLTREFPEFGLTLVGMPDAVFKKRNGKLCVIDYKTAKYKGDDDPFLPIYQAQLWGYAHLLESNGLGKVESAALVYFENDLKAYEEDDPLVLLTKQGFDVPFGVKIHNVEIDRAALKPLLKRVREFAEMQSAPEGLEKCRDCALLQQLFEAEHSMHDTEEYLRRRDQYYRYVMYPGLEARRRKAKMAWNEDEDVDAFLAPMEIQDCVPATWDW